MPCRQQSIAATSLNISRSFAFCYAMSDWMLEPRTDRAKCSSPQKYNTSENTINIQSRPVPHVKEGKPIRLRGRFGKF